MINTKLLEKLDIVKTKIKKQKIDTIAEINEYSKLFDEYSRLSKMIFGTK